MIKVLIILLPLNLYAGWEQAQKILTKSGMKQNFSISIDSLDTEESWSWLDSIPRTPASLTKLAVLSAAIDTYPMDWKFKNELRMKDDKSPICFIASGDPVFVSESMWVLVNDFVRRGIKNIPAGVIVDSSIHNDVNYDQGRSKKRVSRSYDAPISAASFNWNSVNIFIKPTTLKKLSSVYLDPESSYFQLDNEISTVRGKKTNLKQEIQMDRKPIVGVGEKIHLKGKIGLNNSEELIYRNIRYPELWLGKNLVQFLKNRGVQVSDLVRTGSCNAYHKIVASQESKDISLIYRDMMKFSNNFITEMLIKHMPVVKWNKQGSFNQGKKILEAHIKSMGIKDMKIESVSGLSGENKMTSKALNQLLRRLYYHKYSAEILSSLPIAGVDGTIKSRFKNLPDGYIIRAKTGLLNNVLGLSGYILSKDKKYLLTVIYNGSNKYKARETVDKFVAEFLK